jgi:tetratricopeptide (TPR) repeat protein
MRQAAILSVVLSVSWLPVAVGEDGMSSQGNTDLGASLAAMGKYERAIVDYSDAIRIDPKNDLAYNALAWLYATCRDPKFRDGKKAVENATKACELAGWKNEGWMDTLAAAYAESRNFESAVKWQTKARDLLVAKFKLTPTLLKADGQSRLKADFQSRLELYRAHKAYREEPKK